MCALKSPARLFKCNNFRPLEVDSKALEQESVNIAITINGKKRGLVSVSKDTPKEALLQAARQEVAKWLEGQQVLKEVVVPAKLVNFVLA